jgi:two-component system sensor histidine kinase AlgZ
MSLPSPWTARRAALAALAWGAFGVMESLIDGAGMQWWSIDVVAGFYGGLALLWSVLTPLVGRAVAAIDDRRPGLVRAIAAHVVLIAVLSAVDAYVRRGILAAYGQPAKVPPLGTWLFFLDVTAAQYGAIVVATRALRVHDAGVARARHELALRGQLARTRLAHLEAQLQPHFLFNALGAITELAYEAPQAAARMLRQLAALLRSALERRGDEITLREELAVLEPYLEIQRMRFADWLTIDERVSAEAAVARVPRLVLQPLVENAIKHGLAGRTAKGSIEIVGRVDGERLRLVVRDNGVGLDAARGSEGYGIGLRNVRERLATLYGDAAELALTSRPDGGTLAELTIPMSGTVPPSTDAGLPAPAPVPGLVLRVVRRHPVLVTVAGWLTWGAAWVGQARIYFLLRGRPEAAAWSSIVVTQFTGAVLWAVATPLLLWLSRRLALRGPHVAWRALLHAVLAPTIALGHALVWHLLLGSRSPSWPAAYETSIFFGILAYLIILGGSHYGRAMEWLQERETTAAALQAEIDEARLRATTVRAQPEDILRTLDALADDVAADPRRAERELAALADGLRRALDDREHRDAPLPALAPA